MIAVIVLWLLANVAFVAVIVAATDGRPTRRRYVNELRHVSEYDRRHTDLDSAA